MPQSGAACQQMQENKKNAVEPRRLHGMCMSSCLSCQEADGIGNFSGFVWQDSVEVTTLRFDRCSTGDQPTGTRKTPHFRS
eukprot:6477653-Amphidinium_carterae.1